MNIRKLLLIAALGLSSLANADVVTVVNAVETITSNISFPASVSGRLMFRPCANDCDEKFVAVKLTPETKYVVRGKPVDFAEFRTAFITTRSRGDDYALVSYHVETSTVTSIIIGF